MLLTKSRRYQLALEAYRKVLGVDPENPVAWNGIGQVLGELRKFEDARNAYARAIQSRPEYAEAGHSMPAGIGRVSFEVLPTAGSWTEVDDFGGVLIPQRLIQAIVVHLTRETR